MTIESVYDTYKIKVIKTDTELQKQILDLMLANKAVIAIFVAHELGIVRQKASWHLNRLRDEGCCHHAATVRRADSKHFVWVAGSTTDLTLEELTAIAVHQQQSSEGWVEIPARICKTTFAQGINPWTGVAMK